MHTLKSNKKLGRLFYTIFTARDQDNERTWPLNYRSEINWRSGAKRTELNKALAPWAC